MGSGRPVPIMNLTKNRGFGNVMAVIRVDCRMQKFTVFLAGVELCYSFCNFGGHSGSLEPFSRGEVGHGILCSRDVADQKKPRKIGFFGWPSRIFDGMIVMLSWLCRTFS